MNIDKELLEWLDKQVETHVFSNRSVGIRQCIRVAKRVIEMGNPYEITRFFHGIPRDVVHIKKQLLPSDIYWRKTLTRVNHYCISCDCLIPSDSLCYGNTNSSKHLCVDCKEKIDQSTKK